MKSSWFVPDTPYSLSVIWLSTTTAPSRELPAIPLPLVVNNVVPLPDQFIPSGENATEFVPSPTAIQFEPDQHINYFGKN